MNSRATIVCAALLIVAACSGNGNSLSPTTASAAPAVSGAVDGSVSAATGVPAVSGATTTTTTTTTCDSATPTIEKATSPTEVQGEATGGTVYGLLFLTHSPPIRVGEEVKIVWRITGKGNLTITYESPSARPGVLTFGPTPHAGSTYTRPGDEWGAGFLFDERGCWHIHLERTTVSGDVWVDVAAS